MKSRIILLVTLMAILMVTASRSGTEGPERVDYSDCLACHKGIEKISGNHEFRCATCHLAPGELKRRESTAHPEIIRNPSDMRHVDTFCLPCHQREIRQVRNSLHASMAGIINQTRYLWGAQKGAAPAVYGLSGALKPLPQPDYSAYPDTPAMLVDDFLRRRCLRCHIQTTGPGGPGLYRATGCAACHVLYSNEGGYEGGDRAIDRSKKGYPAKHEFTTLIPDTQCLHCHNQNHVGADYEGLFEHDYNKTYRSPLVEGKPITHTYGLDYHHLARDIHAERGLWCIDCHGRQDLMGEGRIYSYQMEVPKRSCADCHGGYDRPRPDLSKGDIVKESGSFFFASKDKVKGYQLTLFSDELIPHKIKSHKRVRCSACHAQWSYQDYGLSVIREDLLEGNKWYYLTAQGDPYLEQTLKRQLEGSGKTYPVSKDWVTGESKGGIWSVGWRFRRWEFMPLGLDDRNRYAVLRPLYQYLVTYVDRLGNIPLDSTVPTRGDGSGEGWGSMPYVPHTIAPFGRRCEGCHLNRMAGGMGLQGETTVDTVLTIPSPPPIKGMRLLNPEEQERLLGPSERWGRERFRWLNR